MPRTIRVKPKDGLNVPGFPREKEVVRSPDVIRKIKDGDLLIVKKVAKKAPAKKSNEEAK